MHLKCFGLSLLMGFFVWGCASIDDEPDAGLSDAIFTDGSIGCTDPSKDDDSDGISNGDEGCVTGRDSDGDKIPDWQDFDSDGDGIYDDIEKGAKDAAGKCSGAKAPNNKWPCDSDGDGVPDYLDQDSDNDGVKDKDEDANGDGELGCCLTTCNKTTLKQKSGCILTKDGCGPGQTCSGGKCTPAVSFDCSNGETNPRNKDTFGDGKLDIERGTFICRDATEDDPKGRKAVALRKSSAGDWHLALDTAAVYGELSLTGGGAKQAAAVIDDSGVSREVAGFVVSRDATSDKVQTELGALLQTLNSSPPGGSGTVVQLGSGAEVKSHDGYDSIQGTIIKLTAGSASNVSSVRNSLIATLLGASIGSLGNLPAPYGSSHTEFVIRFSTVRRFAFKKDSAGKIVKDANGDPLDDTDKSKWRLVVVGAVAGYKNYTDPTRQTGIVVEDLSNGTALATAADKVDNECDVGKVGGMPIADIIWVVDTSGSMYNNQVDVANNASNFFSRALSSGLDFRMAVMPACQNQKICKGRFLLPGEQSLFTGCIKAPGSGSCEQGLASSMSAVKAALPRQSGDQTKVRPDAKLVVIQVTDELPATAKSSIGSSNLNVCTLSPSTKTSLDTLLAQYNDLFTGKTLPGAAAQVHTIAGVCNNSCGAEKAHGYMELSQLTGGQVGDICQKDLGATLQVIIDSVVSGASPVQLEYVPISSSVAVALDGVEIKRSRSNGFDYRSANNALVFIGVKYKTGAEVIASYKRWSRQMIIE
jgi:hypothetical protein